MNDEKNCRNCKFAVHADYGYSNYTVEGTTFHCGKKLHPDDEFDEFYGDEKKLKFAEQCQSFEAGDGIWMDVDTENEADLTPEQRELYNAAFAS